MKQEIEVKSADSVGDIFVKGVDKYLKSAIASDTLRQLVKNYESAFGETPDNEQLQSALNFVDMFLAEISETTPGTKYAQSVHNLTWFIIPDDVIETAERLASVRTKSIKGELIPLARLNIGDHFILPNSLQERCVVEKNANDVYCPLVSIDGNFETKQFLSNTTEVIKLV